MKKIIFVCLGNICRSPMAEFMFKDLLKNKGLDKKYILSSAGTSSEEIGNDMHYGAKDKLDEKNVPYTKHKARKLEKQDYDKFDYIICMDRNNVKDVYRIVGEDQEGKIYRLLDFKKNPRDIKDPWYTGNFEETYCNILEGSTSFLDYLER